MRIVLAEDSVLLREGLVRLLVEAGHEVVAAVGTAPDLEQAVRHHIPDVLIADVRMPPHFADDGLRSAAALRSEFPDLAVLVLSQYVEESYARDLLATGRGGVAYLLKDRVTDLTALESTLDSISQGATVVDPEVIAQLMVRRGPASPVSRLTPREREVLALMAQGRANAAIAAELFVTDGAVEKHIASIYTKLDLPPSPEDHRRVLAVLAFLQSPES
ncbi:MAG: response regulator transcription factor [Micrococcales bacterium]|nr:response regulator transcription factor [Micrococcales bacterium]